jgi:hypothetical protein
LVTGIEELTAADFAQGVHELRRQQLLAERHLSGR